MPRTPATEAQKNEARRHLQKAAAAIYAEQGIAAVSARAVAERAGVSVGTIYSYFGNLQELMQSLWVGRVEQFEAELERVANRHPDPLERIRALLIAYGHFGLGDARLYKGTFLFVRPDGLPTPEPQPLESAAFPTLLIRALREGQRDGRIRRGNPKRMAQLLWAGLHGALALPTNIDRLSFDSSRLLVKDMTELLMQSLELTRRTPP